MILEGILHSGAMTATEIARKTRLATATVKMTIERLQQQELVGMEPRRASQQGKQEFCLTEQGRRSIEWIFEEHLKDMGAIFKVLSDEQRFDIHQSLRQVGRDAEDRCATPAVNPDGGLTPWQLRRVTEFMRRHIGRRITTKEIAGSVELSDSHFRKGFKSVTGVTPHSWLLSARIGEAQKLLREGVVPLSEIASITGFGDQSHFSRTFQKNCGVSPRAWQRDHHLR